MLHKNDFKISTLGECTIPSPIADMTFVSDTESVCYYNDAAEITGFINRGRVRRR